MRIIDECDDLAPGEVVRLGPDHEIFARSGMHDKADVVMPVFRFVLARRDTMPVEIEYRRLDTQACQSGLFFRFAQGHFGKIAITVGMAAQLQPAIQFSVVGEQDPSLIRRYQPG